MDTYLCNVHYPELYDPNKTRIADKLDDIQSNHSLMNYSSMNNQKNIAGILYLNNISSYPLSNTNGYYISFLDHQYPSMLNHRSFPQEVCIICDIGQCRAVEGNRLAL